MKPVSIACVIPIPEDPTSWYRGIGPLSALKKENKEIQFLFSNPLNHASLKLADLVFMQRPCLPEHFNQMLIAKDLGIPVWVDFDDDNLSVPKDNPTYPQYGQPQIKDSIVKLARNADVLTVSTEFLKKKYGIYNKNTIVVPNALDEVFLKFRHFPPGNRQKMLLWRGTMTHQRNLEIVQDNIIRLAQRYPNW